jgi:hypothetical protein
MLLQYEHPLGDYIMRRGLWDRVVPQHLGYYDGWYTIPIYSKNGGFDGMVMRASPHVQAATGARFDIPRGQPALFYVPDWRMEESNDFLCVTFGMFDAIAMLELGLASGTSTSGKDSTNVDQLEWCRKPIAVIPDKGEEDTGRKLVASLGWRGKLIEVEYPENCKDPADCWQLGHGQWLYNEITKEMTR